MSNWHESCTIIDVAESLYKLVLNHEIGLSATLLREVTGMDFKVTCEGNIYMVEPVTQGAKDWVSLNLVLEPWQWLGNRFCVDQHYIENLMNGMQADGMILQCG